MNTLITGDRLQAIVSFLEDDIPQGYVIEAGVYKGGSLKIIADTVPHRLVIGFDTFKGMPKEMWTEREPHQPGDFKDNSLEAVSEFLKDCKNVRLIPGLFPQSAKFLQEPPIIAFAHLDLDFYESTRQALEWVWPRLAEGGVIVFDDYGWPNCPGVKEVLDQFEGATGVKALPTGAKYQAYIKK